MNVGELRRILTGVPDTTQVSCGVVSAPFDDEEVELLDAVRVADRVVLHVLVVDEVDRGIRDDDARLSAGDGRSISDSLR